MSTNLVCSSRHRLSVEQMQGYLESDAAAGNVTTVLKEDGCIRHHDEQGGQRSAALSESSDGWNHRRDNLECDHGRNPKNADRNKYSCLHQKVLC